MSSPVLQPCYIQDVAADAIGEGADGEGDNGVQGNGAPEEPEHFADDDDFDELYGDAQQLGTEVPAADPDGMDEGDEDVEVEVMAAHDDDARANGAVAEGTAANAAAMRL